MGRYRAAVRRFGRKSPGKERFVLITHISLAAFIGICLGYSSRWDTMDWQYWVFSFIPAVCAGFLAMWPRRYDG